ncbi:MAG: hypothetical protein AAF711_06050 [Planctomycetota bacterium]
MANALDTNQRDSHDTPRQPSEIHGHAAALVSQQIWCWGRDIHRPQGNWLLETGFTRTPPPEHLGECPSRYTLTLPPGQTILLRGFGVFFADPRLGCIYLPRYTFQPLYTKRSMLDKPLWLPDDLPRMARPSRFKRKAYDTLLRDLIEWIWRYEDRVAKELGVAYREETLLDWDDGKRPVIPAKHFAQAWHRLWVDLDTNQ